MIANIISPTFFMGQPTEKDGYMIVARDLLQGVEALSTIQNIPPRSCALIAAHALECALKAFLWHKGKSREINLPRIRHDLVELWNMAGKESGLTIAPEPPVWVTILKSGHGPDFYFRYQQGESKTVVHGGQTPALIPMASDLKALIEVIEIAIQN